MQETVSKLLRAAIWSSCAVWLKCEQTPFSRAGHRFRTAALYSIQYGTCQFVPAIFLLGDQWMIEGLSEAIWALLASIPSKYHFTLNKATRHCPKFTKHSNLFDSQTRSLSQERYSTFSLSEPVEASSDCSRLENTLCLCSLVFPAQTLPECCPKSLAIDFAVKSFNFLLE